MQDVFELQRNLNNAFAYDLVPSVSVITAALRAARRVNDFPTAVRVFEGRSPHPLLSHLHRQPIKSNSRFRHQSQGGEQGSIRGIPKGAGTFARGARRYARREHVSRELIEEYIFECQSAHLSRWNSPLDGGTGRRKRRMWHDMRQDYMYSHMWRRPPKGWMPGFGLPLSSKRQKVGSAVTR